MIDAGGELIAVRGRGAAVLKIAARISVAAGRSGGVGERNESAVPQDLDRDRIDAAQRDLIIDEWIAHESRTAGGIGHRSRALGIEDLSSPIGPAQRVGHGGGGQQVLAEVAVALRDARDSGERCGSAGLAKALIGREEKWFA